MNLIVEDRYSGVYSGGKWLVIQDYWMNLTPIELNWLNAEIRDADEFYSNFDLKMEQACKEQDVDYIPVRRDNTLTIENTRFDAVERTLQNSDCYAARWNSELMPWCIATNDVSEYVRPSNSDYNLSTYWSKIYSPEEP